MNQTSKRQEIRSSTPVDTHVGQRLRERRMVAGFTQEQVADSLGVTPQQLQKYETGANRISASRLYQVARVLNVAILSFFEGLEGLREQDEHEIARSEFNDPDTLRFVQAVQKIRHHQRRRRLRQIVAVLADKDSS